MPHVFEIDEILRLLKAAKDDNETAWLLILVSFLHALRASEAVGLKAENITGDRIVLNRLKRSNPVNDELLEHSNPLLNEKPALVRFAQGKLRNQRLFNVTSRTFQRWVHRYGERAGLAKLFSHPHTLKHSILTYLRETMDLDELQDRSGHKSLDSLRVYLNPKKAITDRMVASALGSVKG